jgi:ABC-type cobalamin/Fe3+-siderophores transport system ATPase subunit
MSEFLLNYPSIENESISMSIKSGEILFVVGANGTGKSTIMHLFAKQNNGKVLRITAHRQVWFTSNSVDLTPQGRAQNEQNISSMDAQPAARWKDDYAAARSQITIFDLIDFENVAARQISDAARSGNIELVKALANIQSPISKMNDILKISNLDFQVQVDQGSKLVAIKEGFPPYSIAELSDGERNALLIIANVLTASENTLILLDEPERHLHRSIVSPLLSTLLTYRSDCAFVISTHDVSLPLDQNKTSSLLVRSYNHTQKRWQIDKIENIEEMDDTIASAILGSRRKILFIEGHTSSLDIQLYKILFPDISVKAVGSCVEVERITKGLQAADGNHRVLAIGIIDKDNRSEEECRKLAENGIIAIEQYSVESIYYHPTVINGVLKRVSATNGIDITTAIESYTSGVISALEIHKDRMSARMVERKVKEKVLYETPDWRAILESNVDIVISTNEVLNCEKELINRMLSEKNIAALIARYPVRETPALESISKALGFLSQYKYEQAVRKMLIDSEEERQNVLNIIKPITELVQ